MRWIITLASMVALAGCSTLNQSASLQGGAAPQGLSYSLPTRPMTIEMVYDRDRGFGVSVALLPSIADSKAGAYLLSYRGSAFDNDTVQWTTVDGLLTNVSATSVTRLLDTVQAAGESIGSLAAALETDTSSPQQTVVRLNFDPADATSAKGAGERLTLAMHSFARAEIAREALLTAPKQSEDAAIAARKIRMAILNRALTAAVDIGSEFPALPKAAEPDCSVGICYRPLRFGQVTVSIDNVRVTELGMTVPNGSPSIAFPVRRSGAANSSSTLTLDRGVLSTVSVSKEAEAPNIARVPGTLVGGVIKGFTDTITARKGSVSAQTDLVKAQSDKANADAALIAAQQALTKARTGGGSIEASIDGKAPLLIWFTDGLSTLPVVAVLAPAAVPAADLAPGGKKPADAGTADGGKKPGDAGNPANGGGKTGGSSPPGTDSKAPKSGN